MSPCAGSNKDVPGMLLKILKSDHTDTPYPLSPTCSKRLEEDDQGQLRRGWHVKKNVLQLYN